MILPAIENSGRVQGLFSVGTTVILAALAYTVLALTAVPELRSGREVIRELDPIFLARYVPSSKEAAASSAISEEPVEIAAPSNEASDRDVERAMEELAQRFGELTESAVVEGSFGDGSPPASTTLSVAGYEERLNALFGATTENEMAAVVTSRRSPTDAESPKLEVNAGLTPGNLNPRANLDSALRDITVERHENAASIVDDTRPVMEVRTFEAENYGDLNFDIFAAWIRDHSANLPPGVKVHLGFDPAFATSVVKLNAEGAPIELYLMYKESLRELHVVLVEREKSIYLIDRGFSEKSHALREGVVTRAGDEIITIDSQARPASSQRAQEFYSIFLSWWEDTKSGIN